MKFLTETKLPLELSLVPIFSCVPYGKIDVAIFMPLYEGTLFDLIQKKVIFTESLIHRIALHIATGLSGIHKENFIHRDIKASNIFLAPAHDKNLNNNSYYFLLGDFDISDFLIYEKTYKTGSTGTFASLAPE